MLFFKPCELDLHPPVPAIPGSDLLFLISNQNMIPPNLSFGFQTSFSYKLATGHQDKQGGPSSAALSSETNQQAS